MFTSTFISQARAFDAEFHELNNEIAARARQIPRFLGEEERTNESGERHAKVYYRATQESMQQLIGTPVHRKSKGQSSRWIDDYRLVLGEVLPTYGTPGLGITHAPAAA
ncbi:hypothetical protein [Microbacterium paraoxydans]|uniref:hypothetical protein n=1 Tax=Microbacterium paraoxydans TaxID=199592 RepID=UPI001CFA8773|nr:hypothetical protein [Microbacterium paraoxydans]